MWPRTQDSHATHPPGRRTGRARIQSVNCVGRRRPDGSRFSFPSDHASSSFATATVLQRRLGWRVGVPAYAMATYVAASRLQENRHYLSDVVFGAGLGIVVSRSVTVGHGQHALAVVPLAAPGGVGIGFVRH